MEESTQKNDRFSGTFRASEKKTNSDTSLRMVKECHMVDFVKKNRFSTHFFGWLRIGLIASRKFHPEKFIQKFSGKLFLLSSF
jgi:hypothetical protein